MTEKQEATVTDVLKQHSYPSDFEMLLGEVKKRWKQWVKQVPVIDFNNVKCDINMVKEKAISYKKKSECNEDILAAKKENEYMFLIPKFKNLRR